MEQRRLLESPLWWHVALVLRALRLVVDHVVRPRPGDSTSTTRAPIHDHHPAPSTTPTPCRSPSHAPGWSQALTTLPPGGGFTGLSCISDTFCIAVGGGSTGDGAARPGSGVTASWDGAAWSGPSVYFPAPTSGPISCRPSRGGLYIGTDLRDRRRVGPCQRRRRHQLVDPHRHHSPSAPRQPGRPGSGHPGSRSLRCRAPRRSCGGGRQRRTDLRPQERHVDGTQAFGSTHTTGATVALFQTGRVGVSCPPASSCTAVVGTSVLDWSGSWSPEGVPWARPWLRCGRPDSIACPAPPCAPSSTGPGSSTGTPAALVPARPSTPAPLDGISCPTTSFCMAVRHRCGRGVERLDVDRPR